MVKIEDFLSSPIASPLLLPLWCCATPCRANPDVSYDPKAVELIHRLDFDFTVIKNTFNEYAQVCHLARERNVDATIQAFLAHFPKGTIVNLGCGLSTAAYRTANHTTPWYEIDYPEVIRLRQELLLPAAHHTLVADDLFAPMWMDELMPAAQNGILFLASGIFYQYRSQKIKTLIQLLARRFPGGILFFDALSHFGLSMSNHYLARTTHADTHALFAVNTPARLKKISVYIDTVTVSPYFSAIQIHSLGWATRLNIAMSNLFHMLKYITITFDDSPRH